MGAFAVGSTLACPAWPAAGRFSGSSESGSRLKPVLFDAARNGLFAAGVMGAIGIAGFGVASWTRGHALAQRIQGSAPALHRASLGRAESLASSGRNAFLLGGLLLVGVVAMSLFTLRRE